MRLGMTAAIGTCFLSWITSAVAAPYHFRYDATSLPEAQGWERRFSEPEDGQSVRSVANGVFDLDTTASISIYDSYYSPGNSLELRAGEELRVSWRMQTMQNSEANFDFSDCILFIAAPDRSFVELYLGTNFVSSDEVFGGGIENLFPVQESAAHDYLLLSSNLRGYSLYVDGGFAFGGTFQGDALSGGGRVVFGDAIIGASSRSQWSFVDVRVVPEPGLFALSTIVLVSVGHRTRGTLPVL